MYFLNQDIYAADAVDTFACPLFLLSCPPGEYLEVTPKTDGCESQECLPCPQIDPIRCPGGGSPVEGPPVINQCPTYSCP